MNGHMRYVLDFVFAYTGFKNLTLALNADYGREQRGAQRLRGVRLDG